MSPKKLFETSTGLQETFEMICEAPIQYNIMFLHNALNVELRRSNTIYRDRLKYFSQGSVTRLFAKGQVTQARKLILADICISSIIPFRCRTTQKRGSKAQLDLLHLLLHRGCQMAIAGLLDCNVFSTLGLKDYGSATLHCKICSFLSLDCPKERKGSNFAIWQPCPPSRWTPTPAWPRCRSASST